MKRALLLCVAACGHGAAGAAASSASGGRAHVLGDADRLVGLLPDGAQVIVELDLARLRANPVVGDVVRRALDDVAVSTDVELPMKLPTSPLSATTVVVLAAYGVGTAQAATITLLATPGDVPGGRRVGAGVVALGPDSWLDQVDARAAVAARAPGGQLGPSADMIELRDHAMPEGATGAAIRLTARLSFDARIALARQTGVELAPAQMSVWADVADDFALVVDADAGREAPKKLASMLRGVLATVADAPALRALGLPNALRDARQVKHGTWVRTIVAIGPAQLRRAVARATTLLGPVDPGSGGSGAAAAALGSGSAS